MDKQQAQQIAGGNRWRFVIELTLDVEPEDCETLHDGDTVQDFAHRAFDRVRPYLNDIIEPFAHYHLLESPRACVEGAV